MQKKWQRPLSHWKIKCLFLDYVQLLMIGCAIWAKNIDQNTKKWKRPPKSLKNKIFVFGLCSTSDDRPSDLRKKCWLKCKKKQKRPPKLSKNKMFIFGLCSTSDDWLSDPSKKHQPKCKKMKKAPQVIEKWNVHFWITFNFWWLAEWSEQKHWPKCKKIKKAP